MCRNKLSASIKQVSRKKDLDATINEIANTPKVWPVFIKSVEGKRLSSKIINSIHDLVGCGCCDDNYEVLCSDPVNFIAGVESICQVWKDT